MTIMGDPAEVLRDERDVIHTRPTVATGIAPVIALGAEEGAAYLKLQGAAVRVKRAEAELVQARQDMAKAIGEWSQFAKEEER